jgi:hypothetical protein
MGALLVFSLKSNRLHAKGGKALVAGLKGNQGITELDISDSSLGTNSYFDADTSGISAIADAIPDMRAMTKFDISNNAMKADGCKAIIGALKGNSTLTELNIANTSMNSGRDMSAVTALADVIPGMVAMTSLDISSNYIGQRVRPDGWQLKKGGIFSASKWVHLDGRTQKDKPLEPVGVIAIASAIKTIFRAFVITGLPGALIKLDISKNCIGAAQKGDLQFICVASGIDLDM